MDYKILVKLALIIYIVSMPIVGSVPIYYYVSQVKFIIIYIIGSLIIGLLFDIVISILLIVILIIWIKNPKHKDEHMENASNIVDNTNSSKIDIKNSSNIVDHTNSSKIDIAWPSIAHKHEYIQNVAIDTNTDVDIDVYTDADVDFDGYDMTHDSLAPFEEF